MICLQKGGKIHKKDLKNRKSSSQKSKRKNKYLCKEEDSKKEEETLKIYVKRDPNTEKKKLNCGTLS